MTVVDMSPGVGKVSDEFANYIAGMKEIESARVHSRKEADEVLKKYEPVRSSYYADERVTRLLSFFGGNRIWACVNSYSRTSIERTLLHLIPFVYLSTFSNVV